MRVIEAQYASILVPHDHRIDQMRIRSGVLRCAAGSGVSDPEPEDWAVTGPERRWAVMPGLVMGPHESPAYDFRGANVVIKASGEHTSGRLAVMKAAYPSGLSVHQHIHAGEDEMFLLLSGQLTGFCEEETWTVTVGSFVFVPRDHPHGFTVTSLESAKALVIAGPPQLDRQIAARGEPAADP
jgi:quercetin dioxygenase-like cupin family protein